MLKRAKDLGATSDMFYCASAASIALSIALWFSNKEKDAAHAERFGIFVGLWAPTLAIFGKALEDTEKSA